MAFLLWIVGPVLFASMGYQLFVQYMWMDELIEILIGQQMDSLAYELPPDYPAKVQTALISVDGDRYAGVLDRLHTSTYTITSIITNRENIATGRKVGDVLPLTNWAEYLPVFVLDKCAVIERDSAMPVTKEIMTKNNIAANITCPLMDKEYRLHGALAVSWFNNAPNDVGTYKLVTHRVAKAIASFIALRS